MQRTPTCTISRRRNAPVRHAIRAASKAAGARGLRTVRSTPRQTVRLSVGRAGASGPIRASVAIFFAPVAAQARNRATASHARTSSTTAYARRNVRPCRSKWIDPYLLRLSSTISLHSPRESSRIWIAFEFLF